MRRTRTGAALQAALRERILILDGAMGTMIQQLGLGEAERRGERFADHPRDLAGNHDLLCLTRPRDVEDIHRAYLEAGADIVSTNSFSANRISQADYGLEDRCREMNVAAARLARRACDAAGGPPRYVAGSLGPGNKLLSLSPRVEDPAYREVGFEDVRAAYAEQAGGLMEGGADLLLLETIIDTLGAKAALFGIEDAFAAAGVRLPVMISMSITDRSGRTLSGQTLEAFLISLEHARPLSFGLNCSFGARELRPALEEMARLSSAWVSCHPNAGLPNELGEYEEGPEITAALLRGFAEDGLLNLAGACCGSTPAHIAAIAESLRGLPGRRPPERAAEGMTRYSGLEPLKLFPGGTFTVIGERTNVSGSRRFARLVREEDWDGALDVALEQVRRGANILDVNMDEGMLDSAAVMQRFLRLLGAEPEAASLPVMVDSSRWDVLEAGLRCLQGKSIVNSLSLKDGEEEFMRRARIVRRFGAAVVVMAFDEQGQAGTAERKVEILRRAYGLLTGRVGFPPEDIVLDANVLAVATGLPEHRDHARSFLEALPLLRRHCPGARLSGGVSNLSFAFRGNEALREAMHASFLYHAVAAGLDMGIVNAGRLPVYEDIDPELLEVVEDVLFNRREDATERLIERARGLTAPTVEDREPLAWRRGTVEERLTHALVHGILDHLQEDLAEARRGLEPLEIIEGPLMAGMEEVGDLFGSGRMFLPQVVKSARAMKRAVAVLEPELQARRAERAARGKIVLATVKGDVHDIGKNIVGVVLACNGFEVIDLGVMAPLDRILETAAAEGADMVGLSGLITPSLDEMQAVAREMRRRGMTIPLLIGGATTSRLHTAVKLAPEYGGPVRHVKDASRAVGVAAGLVDPARREELISEIAREQEALRRRHGTRKGDALLPLGEARANPYPVQRPAAGSPRPSFLGCRLVEPRLEELVPYIDWTFFFHAWGMKGRHPRILEHPELGEAARSLLDDARGFLEELAGDGGLAARGVYGFWPASGEGDDLVLYVDEERRRELARLPMLRQQARRHPSKANACLADFLAPRAAGGDYLGAFAVTAGLGACELTRRHREAGDDYRALLVQTLADRLAEAFAEFLHRRARIQWGIEAEGEPDVQALIRERFQGIRPAFGYPACPDHSLKFRLFDLLDAPAAGLALTENGAIEPAASVAGIYLSHPQARYFNVGLLGRDQVEDYASRLGVAPEEVERWLSTRLDYEPQARREAEI